MTLALGIEAFAPLLWQVRNWGFFIHCFVSFWNFYSLDLVFFFLPDAKPNFWPLVPVLDVDDQEREGNDDAQARDDHQGAEDGQVYSGILNPIRENLIKGLDIVIAKYVKHGEVYSGILNHICKE